MDVQTNVVAEILKLTEKHFPRNHDIQIKYNIRTIKHGSVYEMHKVKMLGETDPNMSNPQSKFNGQKPKQISLSNAR